VRSYFVIQTPEGYRTYINLTSVSDATYTPGTEAPDSIKEAVDPAQNLFVIAMKQTVGSGRTQNFFWWQGMAADIVQADFMKAIRGSEPVTTVLLPAED
jgi:hypothetical protein